MPELYPFQRKAVEDLKRAPGGRWVLWMETGTGKTPTTITALKEKGFNRVLIVTPAIVRSHWLREWSNWWPERAQDAKAITMSRGRKSGVSRVAAERRDQAYGSSVQVISYALAGELDPEQQWDAIVFDEAHRLQSPNSKQTVALRGLCRANRQAAIWTLTATLMPNDIKDIWAPLDILRPGWLGVSKQVRYQPYSFVKRYSMPVYTEVEDHTGETTVYTSWAGINPEHADELRMRLDSISTRVTKREIAHLLPPFLVNILRVAPNKQVKFKTLQDYEQQNGQIKLPFVTEWLTDAVVDATHIFIGTYLHETAEKLSVEIRKAGYDVVTITGERYPSPEARNRALDEAKKRDRCIIVGTMHSVGIGISLTFCTKALLAELYPRPETLIQFLGRFSRLDSMIPSSVDVLCLEGTMDERVANLLYSKIEAINKAAPAGVADSKLAEAMNITYTEAQMVEELNSLLDVPEIGGAYL